MEILRRADTFRPYIGSLGAKAFIKGPLLTLCLEKSF
jgi:hypothetical protein